MKNLLLLLAIVFFAYACDQNPDKTSAMAEDVATTLTAEPASDGVFIHISEGYENPHRVLMPLKMAAMMSEDKDVLVYMDIDAVNLLVKGSEDLSMEGFDSFQTYLEKLLQNDVGIYACPTCLEVAGFAPSDLQEGVQVAQKDKFFNFTEGRIITLDY